MIARTRAAGLLPFVLAALPALGPVNMDVAPGLRDRALLILRNALEGESRWVKVHAAEALIAVNQAERVGAVFDRERAAHGGEPEYRIGIWRVFAQVARSDEERQQWTARILDAFLDANGPDRLHASEALAKLGFRATGGQTLELERVSQAGTLAVNARWVLVNDGRAEHERRLVDLLKSTDAGVRGDAAYAIRFLPRLSAAGRDALTEAAAAEPTESKVRAVVIGAAFVHAPALQRPRFKADLAGYAKNGASDQKYEACAALARAGQSGDIPLLAGLLDDRDSDVRIGAAHAILRIDLREPR